jgi:hypothetical protein
MLSRHYDTDAPQSGRAMIFVWVPNGYYIWRDRYTESFTDKNSLIKKLWSTIQLFPPFEHVLKTRHNINH